MAFVDELNEVISKYPRPRRYIKNFEELSNNIIFFRKLLKVSAEQTLRFLEKYDYSCTGYRVNESYNLSLIQALALTDFFGISAEELFTYHPVNVKTPWIEVEEITPEIRQCLEDFKIQRAIRERTKNKRK